ncbi:MAG: hypothetical protein KDI45_04445 [Candidatus Accumulibacter sp.]|nr:hypothetical protein [Accumulibacter sp.]
MTPKEDLIAWMQENPREPAAWLEVCSRLANGPDMDLAWPSLLAAGATPRYIFGMVILCVKDSARDVRRVPNEQESAALLAVKTAVDQLLDAMSRARLLNEGAPFISPDVPTGAPAVFAWTDELDDTLTKDGFHTVNLPGLLRLLKSKCDDHRPENALARQTGGTDKLRVRAFVRRLAAFFVRDFGKPMPDNVARIACAVFQLADPLGSRDVEGILEHSRFGKLLPDLQSWQD